MRYNQSQTTVTHVIAFTEWLARWSVVVTSCFTDYFCLIFKERTNWLMKLVVGFICWSGNGWSVNGTGQQINSINEFDVTSLLMVEDDGIEPTTPCLQSRCSPSWANPPLNSALLCRSFACIVYYASLFASRTACSFNLLRFSCSSARKSAFDQSNIPISVSTCSFYCWYVIRR